MSGAILHGRPKGYPNADPVRLLIDPGSATPEEIAEYLVEISKLSLLMTGHPIVWTTPSTSGARTKLKGKRAGAVHWSDDEDDARCDLDNHGGWLLKTGEGEFVVVEDEHTALLIRTQEQLDDLEKNHDWSEIPT